MSNRHALDRTPPEPAHARLATLEAEVAEREGALTSVKNELLTLQSNYFRVVGALYSRLGDLEDDVFQLEVRLGLRPPPADDETDEGDESREAEPNLDGCANRSAPSPDLKRVFRDIAKAIHPDRAGDERARFRRHSMMAEANRAYAEHDEDRLRLILSAWERSPDSVVADSPDADLRRVERRVAELDQRLIAIDAEFADLHRSAIWRLKIKMDDAQAQGWDLLDEIVREVSRQISKATARRTVLRRQVASSGDL